MTEKNHITYIKRNLPLIFVVTLLLVLPSCRFINHQLNYRKLSPEEAIEWAKQDSARVADSLKKPMLNKKDVKRIHADSIPVIETNSLPEGDTSSRYYIIIGSFADHGNAEQAAGKYSGQEFNTTIIVTTKRDGARLELVSVKTFGNLNKAAIFLKDFQAEYDSGAWIYTRK